MNNEQHVFFYKMYNISVHKMLYVNHRYLETSKIKYSELYVKRE